MVKEGVGSSKKPTTFAGVPLCCMIEHTQDILRYQSSTTKSDDKKVSFF
jgi:hypothetical protein